LSAKVRLSEQNAKGKLVFLFIFERKYLRDIVSKYGLSEQNAKGKLVFLFIFERLSYVGRAFNLCCQGV